MATIVITSYGTLGDHLPYVALGEVLKARGHRVRMAFNESMYPYALKAGLEVVSSGLPILGAQEAQEKAGSWNHWTSKPRWNKEKLERLRSQLTNSFPYLLNACQDAELLISSLQQSWSAAMVHEKIAIPWISAFVMPFIFHPITKDEDSSTSSPSYQAIEEVRRSLGLAELPWDAWKSYWKSERIILAGSCHFSQLSREYSQVIQTGFWFYEDPDWSNWQPNDDLREFVEQEPKPLVLSFSSLPLENSHEVVAVHVQAATKLNRRILIQHGWANFKESDLPFDIDRNDVRFADFMPQDWLFDRAAALIHHGGIGTTARALRNGCPMLVEPYGNDQFFNARQILSLGVGAAMHPFKLTATEVARVLQEKVLTPDYKRRAEKVGQKIRNEQGLQTACDSIESWLRS